MQIQAKNRSPRKPWIVTLSGMALGVVLAAHGAIAQTLALPKNLISLVSPEGEQLLLNSQARTDYWPLSVQFVTQKNQAYCGVASIVMVLNAMQVAAPVAPEYPPFHLFTQDNFFDTPAKAVLPAEVVVRQGMTLDELGQLLASASVKTQVYHAGDTNLEQFRKLVARNLQEPNNFVVVNYLRKTIGQEKGGHISPIAAYNARSDRFLILDVSRYKYPPVWVKAADLWQAMNTVDSTSQKTRGFVLVSP